MTDLSQAELVTYWTDGYHLWDALLAGRTDVQRFAETPCLGFWRKPIHERNEAGNNRRVGWSPVAIFMDGSTMTGRVGMRDMTGQDLVDLWGWCMKNPISEAWWRAVFERGEPWPDALIAKTEIPAANREVAVSDNVAPELPLDQQHFEAIKAAIGAAPKTATSEVEASVALGSKNRIAELRLAADKAGKAIYEPMYRTYTAEQKKWSPMIALATAKEKELNTIVLTFRESERRRIIAEQAEAERKQRDIEEANRRAADRAIARGEPEQPPEVVEIVAPVQATPIAPTYGTRKLKEEIKLILDKVTSWDLLCAHYKNNTDLQTLLMKLAAADIKAGRTVPGTLTREGLI